VAVSSRTRFYNAGYPAKEQNMSLVSSIKELVGKKKETARSAYYRTLATGKADAILEAAAAAGIPIADVEEHARILERAQQLQAVAVGFPDAQKQHADAIKAHERAVSKWQTTITPLQKAVNDTAAGVEQADQAERVARNALTDLVGLYAEFPQLLPREQALAAVRERITADAATLAEGERRNAVRQRVEVAEERVGQAKVNLRNLGEAFPSPMNAAFDVEEERRTRPDRAKAALAELEAAKQELDAATTAADALK
jgi:hypothetical protein